MNTTRKHNERVLTRHELAAELEMHVATVDRWVRQGVIPIEYHKLGKCKGRRVRFRWSAVAKALKIPQ